MAPVARPISPFTGWSVRTCKRDGGLADMKLDPYLRSLHADPRWDAFLRKMGLAD